MKHDKSSFANNSALPESDFAIANGIGITSVLLMVLNFFFLLPFSGLVM